MAELSKNQLRVSVVLALVLYGAMVGGIWYWLKANETDTIERRFDQTARVTQFLPGKEPNVPESWQQPKTEPQAEQPEVTPAQEAPVETPQVEQTAPAPEATAAPVPLQKWQKNARAFDQADTRPRIGLIVTDLGLANETTQAAIQEMPAEVSLAFSSVTPGLEELLAKARLAGHETILTVPMEPQNYPQSDPGPNALLLGLSDADNTDRVKRLLAKADGYVAVMPSMGEKFVTSEQKLAPVLGVFKEEELLVVDSTLNKESLIAPLSRLGKIPFARSDVLIDAALSTQSLDAQLEQLEKTAQQNGQAIAVVLPYPVAFEKIKAWAATLAQKNIVLAPVSALASEEAKPAPSAPVAAPAFTPETPPPIPPAPVTEGAETQAIPSASPPDSAIAAPIPTESLPVATKVE